MLRAGIWGCTGNYYKATWIVAGIGEVVGLAFVLAEVIIAASTVVVGGM